ncbi:MAG: dTDP-4-dehydrorhamnose reductase [Candidatus Aminicenantes bacterium]|nr:dTDP-4-dehydrorhamnose reductase [Candidatus Aminicenantes bacterium]
MKKKVAVIGANGQLGTDICLGFKGTGARVIELNHDDIEISDIDSVEEAINRIGSPDVMINTAAMHHVGNCENEPLKSFQVNGIGARNLALVCVAHDILLVHISTDYVFDGEKNSPYIETDRPCPLNVYGNTKLSGEYFIESTAEKYYILRVSGIYGKKPCRAKGKNFVQTMLNLAREKKEIRVVDDETLTPTFTEDIASQIVKLIGCNPEFGLYHMTAEGSCSWYEFAREIFSITKSDIILNRASPGEFAGNVRRPKYCVLENKHLNDLNLNIMSRWKDGLREYLKK